MSTLTEVIRDKYAATARSTLTNDHAGVRAVAEAFGYTADELASIPAEANMGLSCGNPVASAHLKPGEVVVDLGSGGGLDVFLAAQKVGPTGRAIGIDMTPDMIDRARRAQAKGVNGKPIENVEFHLAPIDALPLPDASVDIIISNCVINLASDKQAVFREMFRVLKPGGRVAVSDIALKRPLPDALREDVMAYVGCIAGAVRIEEYEAGLREAGFAHVAIVDAQSDLNAYAQVDGQSACCSPAPQSIEPCCTPAPKPSDDCCTPNTGSTCSTDGVMKKSISLTNASACCSTGSPAASTGHDVKAQVHAHLSELMQKYNINDYAASVKVFAIKS
jgi:SAM-dependent methyltransferase